MVDIEIVREWLAKADEDFEFARLNFEEGKPFFGQICFHFQQAVEKYLKSYIIANELEFLKIHDLPLLLKICLSKDPSFEQLREDWVVTHFDFSYFNICLTPKAIFATMDA